MEADLSEVASISVEQFYAGTATPTFDFLTISILRLEPPPEPTPVVGLSGPLLGDLTNPDVRSLAIDNLTFPPFGFAEVTIGWGSGPSGVIPFLPPPPDLFLGFIDNITFHPIPEPGSVALLVLGLVGMAAVSRNGSRQEARDVVARVR